MLDTIPVELFYTIVDFDNYKPNNLVCVSKAFNNILSNNKYTIDVKITGIEYNNLNCIYIILDDIKELSSNYISGYLDRIMTNLNAVITNKKKINVKLSSKLDCGCEHYYVYQIFNKNYIKLSSFSKYCNYKPHKKYKEPINYSNCGGGLLALVSYGVQDVYLS